MLEPSQKSVQLTASNHLKSLLDFRHSLTILLNLWNISRDHLRRHSLFVLPNLWNRFKWFREIAFLGITCVLPRSTVANYKQCKSSISVLNNWRHAASKPLGCLPMVRVITGDSNTPCGVVRGWMRPCPSEQIDSLANAWFRRSKNVSEFVLILSVFIQIYIRIGGHEFNIYESL